MARTGVGERGRVKGRSPIEGPGTEFMGGPTDCVQSPQKAKGKLP